jgi:hypothetical protein
MEGEEKAHDFYEVIVAEIIQLLVEKKLTVGLAEYCLHRAISHVWKVRNSVHIPLTVQECVESDSEGTLPAVQVKAEQKRQHDGLLPTDVE